MYKIDFKSMVRQSKVGSIVPVYKRIEVDLCPLEYFARLSDYGREENSVLLESAKIVPKYGERSIGAVNPCLKIAGKGDDFEIRALNVLGERFLSCLRKDLDFCDEIKYSDSIIRGRLRPRRKGVSESERLKLQTHTDIIRAAAFKFRPVFKPFTEYGGLMGVFAYDFIDQFEDLPPNKYDGLEDPDYEIVFADNLFRFDHTTKELYLISNALIMDNDYKSVYKACMETIEKYEEKIKEPIPKKPIIKVYQKISTDISRQEFEAGVRKIKEHIKKGDVFQTVLSMTFIADSHAEPLDIYRELRRINPSPYMFYINNEDGVWLGASPEMCIRVSGDKGKIVELRPIAGTRPRAKNEDDLKFELELKTDPKESAEHVMLLDLARNDVARVSVPGTREVDEILVTEKYSHVQHLVSNVKGVLKPELDALHAYIATANQGTLTGAPKIEAMKLIRKYEPNARGFYGGSTFYLTPSGDFDSCINIRCMRLKDGKAYVRAGAGIVHDSDPAKEYDEVERKAVACLKAIERGGDYE